MKASQTIGVLLMAYGSPETLDDLEAYYTQIRGGRKPASEAVEELKERYRRIGGRSPLIAITYAQARALEEMLNTESRSNRPVAPTYRVYTGMRHWRPFIRETIEQMLSDGIQRAVGLALAPHYSRMSVEAYLEAAQQALREVQNPIEMRFAESWHLHPIFLAALSERVRLSLERFSLPERTHLTVIFTAHSLPERILYFDDPYPHQLRETCEALAQALKLERWRFAYQSAGHTQEPWLGPNLLDVLENLKEDRAVLICPIGFVADHLEVLYDIDVECRKRAGQLGLHLERTDSLNDDPTFIRALAAIVREHSL